MKQLLSANQMSILTITPVSSLKGSLISYMISPRRKFKMNKNPVNALAEIFEKLIVVVAGGFRHQKKEK